MDKYIVICDDDAHDLDKTRATLEKFLFRAGLCYIISCFSSGEALIKDIKNGKIRPDIIFIDIELSGESGVETVQKINILLPKCHIIYTTHHLQYATDVYTTEHRYFVLKSELEERLPTIFERINIANGSIKQDMIVPLKRKGQLIIPQKDIICIERQGRGTKFHTIRKTISSTLSMEQVSELLEDPFLLQCHNSFFIGLYHVKSYKRESVELDNGSFIPISRRFQPIVRNRFAQWTQEHLF